jgi:hypothetical protein
MTFPLESLMVGTSLYESLEEIAQNLAVNTDGYDVVEVTIFARELAFYTPIEMINAAEVVAPFSRRPFTEELYIGAKPRSGLERTCLNGPSGRLSHLPMPIPRIRPAPRGHHQGG